jgi:hypothetical protein
LLNNQIERAFIFLYHICALICNVGNDLRTSGTLVLSCIENYILVTNHEWIKDECRHSEFLQLKKCCFKASSNSQQGRSSQIRQRTSQSKKVVTSGGDSLLPLSVHTCAIDSHHPEDQPRCLFAQLSFELELAHVCSIKLVIIDRILKNLLKNGHDRNHLLFAFA